jgi:predicted metalloprotease with PDZ domain
MNTFQKPAARHLAAALVGAVGFPLALLNFSTQSRAEEPQVAVQQDDRPIAVQVEVPGTPPAPPAVRVVEPAGVVVDGRASGRTFRVADLRAPDVGIWFDPAATDSLVIAAIDPASPVAQLDLEDGDRILEVNRVKVTRETDFIKLLFATKARDGRVEILLVRNNKEMVVPVEPALLREHYLAVRHDPLEQLGLVIDDRYDDRVVIWKVLPRTPAFYAGIRPGDVITKWGDQRIVERGAFTDLVPTIKPGRVAIDVNRGDRVRPLRLEVPRDWSAGSTDERFPVSTGRPNDRKGAPSPLPRAPREDNDGRD